MGMAYANNLVYIVCFYLTIMGLALAKSNNDLVDNAFIENVYVKDVYAENDQILYVVVKNTSSEFLRQVEIKIAKQKFVTTVDLKPNETQTVEILWTPAKRGLQKMPNVRLQSPYPAGLFRAWKIMKGQEDIVIYAARKGLKQFPEASFASQDSVGVLKEIRDYQAGDSPKRIHWRSLAKNAQLRTLIHEGNEGQVCTLDWNLVQNLPLDTRIEQLTTWISIAEAEGIPWNLKLPHLVYDSQNINAAKSALTELAMWK